MYYIVNHTEHIIATDRSLLRLLSVENIDELYTKIALGDIKFTPSHKKITITTENGTKSYQTQNHMLYGLLGNITLVHIESSPEEEISAIDDEFITFSNHGGEETKSVFEENILFENEPFDLMSNVEEVTAEAHVAEKTSTEELEDNTSPIVIDIENISQEIGISTNDYEKFLNEYIDTALTLEEDLKDTQETKRTHAINTLSHLSNILHLPVIANIIKQIEDPGLDDRDSLVKSLYTTLARLTTTQINTSTEEEIEFPVEPTAATVEKNITTESFGTIDLDNVQPIHFDFQIEAAANELSLPIELIQEFVHDFMEQTHIETEKMLDAYEKGDLDTIQKIAHLLKGTASNLRINPLADSLYKIQFCEESSNLKNSIKEYWGHFLFFETQINLTSK